MYTCLHKFLNAVFKKVIYTIQSTTFMHSTCNFVCLLAVLDCSCLNVLTDLQEAYSGRYYVQTSTDSHYPVYKHAECDYYIYYLDSEVDYWVFGPEAGGKRGFILAEEDVPGPHNVTGPWRVFVDQAGTWLEDPNLSITCDCPGRCLIPLLAKPMAEACKQVFT